ncbi:MAG TPA: hybrid sensor histidine kinase/response regulator [Myxococcales bacterium]|nr:hybrid sensor histidine kinase/response regulator [Myxococcales bacterium]
MRTREELQASSVQQSDKFPLAKFIPSLMSIPTWLLLYFIAALLGAIYTPEEQISLLPFLLVPTTITAIDFFLIITKILRKTPISMKSYTLVLMATHAIGAVFIAVAFVPDTYNGLFLIFVDSIGLLFLYNRAGFIGGAFFQILAVCIFATSKAIVGSPWESDDILVTIFCGFTLLAYCPFFEAVLRTKTKLRTKTRELLEEQKRLNELTITLDKQVHERTNDLRESNQELHRLNQQKTHFFQNISHELRTPLTLILNPLEEESNRYPDNKNLEIALPASIIFLILSLR